ncbi:hypothetical protein [Mycolicibacter arupensis]|uniref:Uncharacterized protein n=1 Tax=Mycolicibacter arupensis TaxID=342002 RepID=A0A0F5N1Z4_9MYCO|nr:hypothetical protein [Mycolicibacter arupensis]KKC00890.1 hypothetical protein WR43_02930 [Mycolicibacter arupensis]MCV7274493.1 hypothetical protein [Mycolicibacter arupensis]OQZ99347.1 hypothetical protein BST15_07780 [Mycolicibacter arupensis]
MNGLLNALNGGRAAVEELDDPLTLRRHVDDLMAIRRAYFDGYGLYAATPHAERLIGAAMIIDPTIRADGIGDTVIVGVNIASGTQIARAATRLRDSGTGGILVGVVLNALMQGWHFNTDVWTVPEVEDLVILRGPDVSGLRKLAKCGERGVRLALC